MKKKGISALWSPNFKVVDADADDDDDDDVDGDDDVNYFKRSTWWPILQMYKNAVPFIFLHSL